MSNLYIYMVTETDSNTQDYFVSPQAALEYYAERYPVADDEQLRLAENDAVIEGWDFINGEYCEWWRIEKVEVRGESS